MTTNTSRSPGAFESAAVTTPVVDPTDVLGRRMSAFLIDALLVGVATFIAAAASARPTLEEFADLDEAEAWCAAEEAASSVNCIATDGAAVTWVGAGIPFVIVAHLSLWLAMALIEGLTGASIGKHVRGLRVVDAAGVPATIRATVIRYTVGIVESFPWGAPMLVGLFFAANSNGHQRLGDRLAGTFVVGRDAVGAPIPDRSLLNPILPEPAPLISQPPPPRVGSAQPRAEATLPVASAPPTVGAPDDSPTVTGLDAAEPPRSDTDPVEDAAMEDDAVEDAAVPPGVFWDDTVDAWVAIQPGRELHWNHERQLWVVHPLRR